MAKITQLTYTGQEGVELIVEFRQDGWFNATGIAKVFNKEAKDWLKTAPTQEYVIELANHLNINHTVERPTGSLPISYDLFTNYLKDVKLIEVSMGGNNQNKQGTWMHPKLTIPFVRWLNAKFAVWCDEQIENILHPKSLTPANYIEALKALVAAEEEKLRLSAAVEEMTPKAELYDKVMDTNTLLSMEETAKLLDLGFGRNKLFKELRERKVLRENNVPYQEFLDRGYFKVREQTYKSDRDKMHLQTFVTQKGLEWLAKTLNKYS